MSDYADIKQVEYKLSGKLVLKARSDETLRRLHRMVIMQLNDFEIRLNSIAPGVRLHIFVDEVIADKSVKLSNYFLTRNKKPQKFILEQNEWTILFLTQHDIPFTYIGDTSIIIDEVPQEMWNKLYEWLKE